jgi:hypothetical protein
MPERFLIIHLFREFYKQNTALNPIFLCGKQPGMEKVSGTLKLHQKKPSPDPV